MKKPLLQIALDTLTIEEAFAAVDPVKDEIEVVEVGTILLASLGKKAVRLIKDRYPDKIIIADGKIADAGSVFGKMFFDNGCDFTTCICAAETSTINAVLKTAQQYGPDKDVQVELTSHFTWQQVAEWAEIGIKQVVYHRSRDAQAAGVQWTKDDYNNIKKLIDLGFKVTITGGIVLEDITFFKDLPIYIFIVGRAIRDVKDPQLAASQFQAKLREYYQ